MQSIYSMYSSKSTFRREEKRRGGFSHSVAPHHFTWTTFGHRTIHSSLPPPSFSHSSTNVSPVRFSPTSPLSPLHLSVLSSITLNPFRSVHTYNKYVETPHDKFKKKEKKSRFKKESLSLKGWQRSILKLQNMLWTSFMGPSGQITYLACTKIPEFKNMEYKMERKKGWRPFISSQSRINRTRIPAAYQQKGQWGSSDPAPSQGCHSTTEETKECVSALVQS